MGYTKSVIANIGWMGFLRVITKTSSFLKIMIAARILGPSGYGVFAVASLVLALLEILTDTGVSAILIQEERGIKKYLNTAWIINIARGFLISILIVICAKPISIFFNQIGAYPLILLLALSPLIRGFINPSVVNFQKNLEFNKELMFRSPILILEMIFTIFMLIFTKSPVALIWGMIFAAFVELLMSWLYIRPLPKFEFQITPIIQIIKRGRWITSSGIFLYLFTQGDDWFVGKIFGSSMLGIYQIAYKLATLPVYETGNIIIKVLFPTFVKIREDNKRLQRTYIKTTFATILLTVPYILLFFVFTPQIIQIILGDGWASMVSIVRILLIYSFIMSTSGISSGLFLAIKKQEYTSNILLLALITMAITIYPLSVSYGVAGVCYSVLFSWIIAVFLTIYYLKKVFNSYERS